MSEKQTGLTDTEIFLHALWLVDNRLVDNRCSPHGRSNAPTQTILRIRMQSLGSPDERLILQTIERFLQQPLTLLNCLNQLCTNVCQPHHGLPLLRADVLSRQLIRIIDPDILICLCHGFYPASNDGYDWHAIPLRSVEGAEVLLNDGSIDTHIHLGGALPPLFYWLALMSGTIPVNMMLAFSEASGYACRDDWVSALTHALQLRYRLALFLNDQSKLGAMAFPLLSHLTPQSTAQWKDNESAVVRDQILGSAINPGYDDDKAPIPGFNDPLAPKAKNQPHYASGERQLLCRLNHHLRRNHAAHFSEREQIESQLLDYLRIRNAFHQTLVHDRGTDGLMRFIETFGRRRFCGPRKVRTRTSRAVDHNNPERQERRQRRARRQRKRYRTKQSNLERFRMRTALDAQLIHAFDMQTTLPNQYAPVRGIEIRISIPTGRLFKPLMRTWLEGFRDHLIQAGTENASPCSTQVALLFHLIKTNNHQQTAEETQELTRKLGCMLKDHPELRRFIIGLDAAGDERCAAPRTFGEAFRYLRNHQAMLRIPSGQPDIRLGWTYHVGEDVDDLLTGLRHLDEAATLLLGMEGGRLGHALALGDNPARFYQQRGGKTEPTLGCYLLDLVWAYGRLTEARKPKQIAWIESTIRNQIEAITHDKSIHKPNIAHCFQAMQLDTHTTDTIIRRDAELLTELLPNCNAEVLMQQPVNIIADKRWIKMVTTLQSMLRKRLARRRICIEANPTSNLLIGHYTDYSQLPYQTLVDDELALSINTDDPGLFMTSLPSEFSAMYSALAKDMSHRKVLEWLAARQFDAEQSSFITAQTRAGADALINKDDFDALFHYTMESPWTTF